MRNLALWIGLALLNTAMGNALAQVRPSTVQAQRPVSVNSATLLKMDDGRSGGGNLIATTGVRGFGKPPTIAAHALIMTIGDYQGNIPKLNGVAHDGMTAAEIAKRLGVPAGNISMLKDEQLTLEGMRQAFDELEAKLGGDDQVFIYYSGHGGRQLLQEAGGERCAESLITVDGQGMFDSELESRLKRMAEKSQKTIVFLDACHSGGVTTRSLGSPAFAAKSWAPSSQSCAKPVNVLTRSLGGARPPGGGGGNFIHVAAAKDNEIALDQPGRGGVATQAWLTCLSGAARDMDGSGGLSAEEIRTCAQEKINEHLKDSKGYLPHHVTLTGNSNMVLSYALKEPVPVAVEVANQADASSAASVAPTPSAPTTAVAPAPAKPPTTAASPLPSALASATTSPSRPPPAAVSVATPAGPSSTTISAAPVAQVLATVNPPKPPTAAVSVAALSGPAHGALPAALGPATQAPAVTNPPKPPSVVTPVVTPAPAISAAATSPPAATNSTIPSAPAQGVTGASKPQPAATVPVTASPPVVPAAPGPSQSAPASTPAQAVAAPALTAGSTSAPPQNVAPSPIASLTDIYNNRDDRRLATLTAEKTVLRINRDDLRFTLSSREGGYVYLLMVGSDGKTFDLLFPNRLDGNNVIEPNGTMKLPRSAWELTAGGPPGKNTLLAIVAENPRDFSRAGLKPSGPFSVLAPGSGQDIQMLAASTMATSSGECGTPTATRTLAVRKRCSTSYAAALLTVEEVR